MSKKRTHFYRARTCFARCVHWSQQYIKVEPTVSLHHLSPKKVAKKKVKKHRHTIGIYSDVSDNVSFRVTLELLKQRCILSEKKLLLSIHWRTHHLVRRPSCSPAISRNNRNKTSCSCRATASFSWRSRFCNICGCMIAISRQWQLWFLGSSDGSFIYIS